MIFQKMGEIVTKHPYAVIAVWAIVMMIAVVFSASLGNRIEYDTTKMIPKDLASVQADEMYKAAFGQGSENAIIVVVQSDNHTEARLFIEELNASIYRDTSLDDPVSAASIYSAYDNVLAGITPRLYNAIQTAPGGPQALPGSLNGNGSDHLTGANASDVLISRAMGELGIEGNTSFFMAVMGLGPGMTDAQLGVFAREWARTHDYDNPAVLPPAMVKGLTSGDLTLYTVHIEYDYMSTTASDTVQKIRSHITDLLAGNRYPGLQAFVTGSAAFYVDTKTTSMNDISSIDVVAVLMIILLLGIYFRSFLSPVVMLITAGLAIMISMGLLGLMSYFMEISFMTLTFLMVITMGACADYCVFTLSRYAEERRGGARVRDAVLSAVEHAGKSVASSGTTAMIGFGALALIDSGMFRSMGLGVAGGILASLLIATTLLPAVITLLGDRLFWPRKVFNTGTRSRSGELMAGITRAVIKRPLIVIAISLLLLVLSGLVVTQLSLSNDSIAMMPSAMESKTGYNLIDGEFGSGNIARLNIIATMPQNITTGPGVYNATLLDQIEQVSGIVASVPGIARVQSATRPDGATINYAGLAAYPPIEQGYYRSYMDASIGKDRRTTVVFASLEGSPYSEQSGKAIDAVREKLAEYTDGPGQGTTIAVGGAPAGTHDYQDAVTGKYGLVFGVVFAGLFLVLMAILRSVFTPLRLIATLVMTIVYTLAAYILVFQGWMGVPTSWILPVLLFCTLMGLGVDYDIFLVSRVREEFLKGKSDEDAVVDAVRANGPVIMLCGAVMAAAFGSLMVAGYLELKEFGFVIFVSIIIDSIFVRLILVPSVMVLMKRYNWWIPSLKKKAPPLQAVVARK